MWKVVNYFTDTVVDWYDDEVLAEERMNELNREVDLPEFTYVFVPKEFLPAGVA